ncbi:MAG: motility associated factor glycosyltransferase family protein [Gammaproteobacteria bacterium]|nr:motility associated factor glycosyltransferase family protein [Gammaproteobacteria bacterium]
MAQKIIEKLLRAKNPKRRGKIVLEQRDRNIAYFKKRNAEVANFIETRGSGRFEINMTADFLDIYDRKNQRFVYPRGKLFDYVTKLGAWHHNQWMDKLDVLHMRFPDIEHGKRVRQFVDGMHTKLPHILERMRTGKVSLPRLKNGHRYSGSVAFIGLGSGLHIVQYLNRTEVRDLILIEPDLDFFALSCFFLDYAAIQKLGRLILHLGADIPEQQLSLLFNESSVTAGPWLRILPGYPSKGFDAYIQRFHLRWRAMTEIFVPFDREMRNAGYGLRNLQAKLPVNHRSPALSADNRIIVVGSGPSLSKDLEWLAKNQDRLIIMSAHSAVKVLKKHGIRPDFQCSLDTEYSDTVWERLELDPAIPYISYFKADPAILAHFQSVLLLNEVNKANPVLFDHPISFTHPTSGNLATAAAVFARPRRLFFAGLDLGFSDTRQQHYQGFSIHDTDEVPQAITATLAKANFSDSQGKIHTQSYHDSARMSIENAIKFLNALSAETEVSNLSDGVQIAGARACRSDTLDLPPYPEKSRDIEAFHAAFTGESEGIWKPYTNPGQTILDIMRESFIDTMTFKSFNWHDFCIELDKVWNIAVQRCVAQEPGDLRVEIFGKLIHNFLMEWYRTLIFSRTPREAETTYNTGLEELAEAIGDLHWPEELDISDNIP